MARIAADGSGVSPEPCTALVEHERPPKPSDGRCCWVSMDSGGSSWLPGKEAKELVSMWLEGNCELKKSSDDARESPKGSEPDGGPGKEEKACVSIDMSTGGREEKLCC
jgi:hypothetical protein